MTKKKAVPAIRFKGFDGEWEEKILGDIADTYSGGTPSVENKDYYSGNIPFIRSGEIYSQSTELFISENALSQSSASLVRKGDILYALYGATSGEVSISNISGAINQAILAIIPKNGYSRFYILQWLSGKKNNIIATYLQGGQGNLSGRIVNALKIQVPSSPEQIRIGELFRNLDTRITLEQRKYDKLKNIKKALLEKMFPRAGATVPEVRFKGFSGEWEEKKLSSVGIFNPKAEIPEYFRYVDLESVIGIELICFRNETKKSAPSRAQRLAQHGDFFYQTVRPYQKNNYLFDKTDTDYVFSTGYTQIRPLCDGYFILCLVQTELFVKEVLIRCTGTSYPAISANDLSEIEVHLPLDNTEQTRIGELFRNLDTLVSLQQRKCEKLQNIKKAMLGTMFV